MNKDEQIEEYEISFYTFIFEEEDNKALKKNDIKRKDNFGFAIFFFTERQMSFFKLYEFCHMKQEISSLLPGFPLPPTNLNFFKSSFTLNFSAFYVFCF